MTTQTKARRKRFQPNDQQRTLVKVNMICGIPLDATAHSLGISVEELEKHFADEIAHGADEFRIRLAHGMLKEALEGKDKVARRQLITARNTGRSGKPVDPRRQIPPPDANGKVILTMHIGMAGESLGGLPRPIAEDDDEDD